TVARPRDRTAQEVGAYRLSDLSGQPFVRCGSVPVPSPAVAERGGASTPPARSGTRGSPTNAASAPPLRVEQFRRERDARDAFRQGQERRRLPPTVPAGQRERQPGP